MVGATLLVLCLAPSMVLAHSSAHKYLLSEGTTEGSHSNARFLAKLLSIRVNVTIFSSLYPVTFWACPCPPALIPLNDNYNQLVKKCW